MDNQRVNLILRAVIHGVLFWFIMLFYSAASFAGNDNTPNDILNKDERAWLDVHDGKIRLAPAPDWEPMEFFDENGVYQGMVADYIRLIEKKLEFKFKIVRIKSWEKILSLAKQSKIDVLSAAQATPARKQFMNWSTPYLDLKTTIIVEKSQKKIFTLDQMQGMKIGVPKEYAVGKFIRDNYPKLTLIDVLNGNEGMHKVSFGELDAMIMEVPNALHVIETEKITNLRLAGDTGFELNLGLGIRKDWPVLAAIFEKALAGISEKEHKEIYAKWIRLETTRFYQTQIFWYIVSAISLAVLFITGSVLIWNRMLKIQVMQRTEELRFNEMRLEALLELNERTHASIRETIDFAFQQMIRLTKSRFGYLAFEDHKGIIYEVYPDSTVSIKKNIDHNLAAGFNLNTKEFWKEVIDKGKPVILNKYNYSNIYKKGFPIEYKKILRYMSVPVFSGDKIVAVAGMGNKKSDYDSSDLRQLSLLTQGMWRLIQRKKSERAIQRSEKRFRDLVENSPNGIAIIQDGEVVYKNSRQSELMGNLGLFGSPAYKQIHQDDLKKAKQLYEQILKGALVQSEMDFRFYTSPDQDDPGTMKWVNCITRPIDHQDKKALLLITIDMTRAKELERLLTVQDKMASLGHVSAGIAHEIRNPLSGINIYIRTIEKSFENPNKKHKIKPSIDAIRSASKKMESVIKRVMNFAKPTEPKFDLIDITVPILEAVELSNTTLKKKKISIRQKLDKNLPLCHAEPNLIEEVILNLINNAADALLIKSEKRIIEVSSYAMHDKLVLNIDDNGPGIPRDLRQKIFEPFFTTKKHSTGIGLSLCHRVITDHKGTLKVISSRLGGAKFTIEMPVCIQS
jgi:PAS domain S-box-containing protein